MAAGPIAARIADMTAAPLLSTDMAASSALTRERTGWTPTHPGLIDDLEAGHYFA